MEEDSMLKSRSMDSGVVVDASQNSSTKKFITSALPYVNNQPHLGNIIGSLLSADVYARFCRKMGYDTIFICGTDEYGTATEMAAVKATAEKAKHHMSCAHDAESSATPVLPIDIVLKNRQLHCQIYRFFNLSFDYFGHTHCTEHRELVQDIFMKTRDYFQSVSLTQYYCENCEQFLADRYVEGTCVCGQLSHGDQCDGCGRCFGEMSDSNVKGVLSNVRCVICDNCPSKKSTNHLYLRLDRLQTYVSNLDIDKWSENAKSIYRQWIAKDIRPRCMTRLLKYKWGVPVPLEDFEDYVFYVWFDAPIGYLTFLKQALEQRRAIDCKAQSDKQPCALAADEAMRRWLNGSDFVQFMGKDNVPFHSIMFPSTLFAWKLSDISEDVKTKCSIDSPPISSLGEVEPSTSAISLDFNIIINATEYLTFNGRKFSKSKSVGIFGMDLINSNLGDISKWKFYLLKRRPETKDADFNIEEFIAIVNNELIANLGNFINRTLKYLIKKSVSIGEEIEEFRQELYRHYASCDSASNSFASEIGFVDDINLMYSEYIQLMDSIKLRSALDKVLEISQRGNRYLQNLQNNKEKMPMGYSLCYSLVSLLSHCINPFLPEASEMIDRMIGNDLGKLDSVASTDSSNATSANQWNTLPIVHFPPRFEIVLNPSLSENIDVVFTKFTDQQIENLREYSKQ